MEISGRVNKVYFVSYGRRRTSSIIIYVPRRRCIVNLEQSPVASSLKWDSVLVVVFFFHIKRSYLEALDDLSRRYLFVGIRVGILYGKIGLWLFFFFFFIFNYIRTICFQKHIISILHGTCSLLLGEKLLLRSAYYTVIAVFMQIFKMALINNNMCYAHT